MVAFRPLHGKHLHVPVFKFGAVKNGETEATSEVRCDYSAACETYSVGGKLSGCRRRSHN